MGGSQGTQLITVAGARSTTAGFAAFVGSDLIVGGGISMGSTPNKGLYAHLSRGSLMLLGSYVLSTSMGQDELWEGAVGPSGNLWFTGTTDSFGTPAEWGIKGTPAGQSCAFLGPAAATHGKTIYSAGGSIYVGAQDAGGQMLLVRYNESDCSVTSPCPCTPAFTSPTITVGTAYTDVRQLIVVGAKAYVAGYAADTGSPSNQSFGFVAQLDAATGANVATYRFDPTVMLDAFSSIASDGELLYVAGAQGYDGGATYQGSTPVLLALPLGFGPAVAPQFMTNPGNMKFLWGVGADPGTSGSLYIEGFADSNVNSVVAKCTKTGICP
jgi:hypothetical protein